MGEVMDDVDIDDGDIDDGEQMRGQRAKTNLLTDGPRSSTCQPPPPDVYTGVDRVPPSLLAPKRDTTSDWQHPSTPGYQRMLDLKPLQELPLRSPSHVPPRKKKDTAVEEKNNTIESKFGGDEGEGMGIDIEHGVPFTFFTSTPTPRSTTPRNRAGRTPLSPGTFTLPLDLARHLALALSLVLDLALAPLLLYYHRFVVMNRLQDGGRRL